MPGLVLALFLSAPWSHRVRPQQGPLLEGRVLLAGDSVPVPNLGVRLHRVTPDSGMVFDSTVTDAAGRFRFRLRRTDGSGDDEVRVVHMASARYQGVLYFGSALHGGEVPAEYRVVVHPARVASEVDTVSVAARTLIVSPEAGRTDVMDVIDLRAGRDSALVGGEGRGPWWEIELPEGARSPRVLPGGLGEEEISFEAGAVRSGAALPPTGRRLVLGYRLEDDDLRLELARPVERFELVFRGAPGDVRVEGLAPGDTSARGDGRFVRYRGAALAPGALVTAEWRGEGDGGSTLAWILVAVGALLAGAAVLASRWYARDEAGVSATRRGAAS